MKTVLLLVVFSSVLQAADCVKGCVSDCSKTNAAYVCKSIDNCIELKCKPLARRVIKKAAPKPAPAEQRQNQEQSTVVNVTVEAPKPVAAPTCAKAEPLRRNIKVGVHAGYGRTGLKLSNLQTSEATISQDRGFIGGGYLGVRVYKDLWLTGNGLSNGDAFGSIGLEF